MKMKTGLFEVLTVISAFAIFAIISQALAGPINIKGSGTNDAKVKIDAVEGDHPTVNFLNNGNQKGVVGWYRTDDAMKFLYATTLNSSNGITLKSDGNVGIGLTEPVAKLHASDSWILGTTSTPGENWKYGFHGYLSSQSGILYEAGGTFSSHVFSAYGGGYIASFGTSANPGAHPDQKVIITNSGDVGIGTTEPSYKLHVNGDAAGTSWTNLSSREFKEDIRKVDDGGHPMMLAKLMDMEITTYKYKPEFGGDGEVKLGFISEDMPQEVLSKDGKGVDLYQLLAVTVGAMKAQQKEIEEQRKENEELKAELASILARLQALER